MPESDARKSRIGFVGLGAMGAPMVRMLAREGWPLTIFDINEQRAGTLGEETGAVIAGDLREIGACTDIVITMLPNADIVRKLLSATMPPRSFPVSHMAPSSST